MAKEFAKENQVEFVDVDVAADQDRASEMIEKSGQMGVPVIIVPKEMSSTKQEEVIVGFDRDRMSELLSVNA